MIKNKTSNEILPYTYLLKFFINNEIKYYYGVRYGNVRLNINPSEDLFNIYFTSSKCVKILLNNNIKPFEIIIHKTFNTSKDACKFEVDFLTRLNVKNRRDFLNQTNHFDNSLPYSNHGRIISNETKSKMSISSHNFQSNDEYKKYRSELMKKKWLDPEYIKKMKEKNETYWNSDEGKKHKKIVSKNWVGKKHNIETKAKMSLSAINACKNIDCNKRAMKRIRYNCPLCNKLNLDGGNFNSHMISRHEWNKNECISYKNPDSIT